MKLRRMFGFLSLVLYVISLAITMQTTTKTSYTICCRINEVLKPGFPKFHHEIVTMESHYQGRFSPNMLIWSWTLKHVTLYYHNHKSKMPKHFWYYKTRLRWMSNKVNCFICEMFMSKINISIHQAYFLHLFRVHH